MLVSAEVWSVVRTEKGSAVLVKPKDQDVAIPIYIGTSEAQNILIGMLEDPLSRPLTHDLFLTSLRILDTNLLQVEIHTLSEGTFYAALILQSPNGKKEIDCRPSDALALAVRKKCPIFVNEDLVEEVAIPLDLIRDVEVEGSPLVESEAEEEGEEDDWEDDDLVPEEPLKTHVEILKATMQRLVDEEKYEEAARLRDEIKKLDS